MKHRSNGVNKLTPRETWAVGTGIFL